MNKYYSPRREKKLISIELCTYDAVCFVQTISNEKYHKQANDYCIQQKKKKKKCAVVYEFFDC